MANIHKSGHAGAASSSGQAEEAISEDEITGTAIPLREPPSGGDGKPANACTFPPNLLLDPSSHHG